MNLPTTQTVAQVLQAARHAGVAHADARYLLCHLLQVDRAWLISHDHDPLAPELASRYAQLCARLAAGEPLAYLTGQREFHGLLLQVAPGVLIPRPDTEVLVDWALEHLAMEAGSAPTVVDLGTGSGAIALAVAHRHPSARVQATDLSEAALAQAQANAARLSLPVRFSQGRWWQAVAGQRFDLALSNPPYIAADDPHLAALRHEPLGALTPGGDGLDDLRALIQGASAALNPGAWLLLEHGWDQAAAVRAMLTTAGFERVTSRLDLAGHERCTGGRWPGEAVSP